MFATEKGNNCPPSSPVLSLLSCPCQPPICMTRLNLNNLVLNHAIKLNHLLLAPLLLPSPPPCLPALLSLRTLFVGGGASTCAGKLLA